MSDNEQSKTLLGMLSPEHEKSMNQDKDKSKWLWRYMDLSKFVHLLNRKAIFFTNANRFEDKREGLLHTPRNVRAMNILAKMAEIQDENSYKDPNEWQRTLRDQMAVSCWTQASSESVALWKMYTNGIDGVCIRTNLDTLLEQFNSEKIPVLLHKKVTYSGLGKIDELDAFFRKTPEWAFESEYRFLVNMAGGLNMNAFKPNENEPSFFGFRSGVYVPVEPLQVIKEIRVHYQAPNWIYEDIKALTKNFLGTDQIVNRSELNDEL